MRRQDFGAPAGREGAALRGLRGMDAAMSRFLQHDAGAIGMFTEFQVGAGRGELRIGLGEGVDVHAEMPCDGIRLAGEELDAPRRTATRPAFLAFEIDHASRICDHANSPMRTRLMPASRISFASVSNRFRPRYSG